MQVINITEERFLQINENPINLNKKSSDLDEIQRCADYTVWYHA